MKRHVQSLKKGSQADQYVVQNLTWSGVYLSSTLSSDLLQNILKLVPLTETGPGVNVAIMNTALSDSNDSLVNTLNNMKILKLKHHPGENVEHCCDAILVDVDLLESA